MQRYLRTARRYRWLLVGVFAVIWISGLVAAVAEYATTYESAATIWVQRPSPELASSPDDPTMTVVQTASSQQAALLTQLIRTDAFMREVVGRTSLGAALDTAKDQPALLDRLRKDFRVDSLGTNLMSVAFNYRDPQAAYEMVEAAIAVRGERVAQSRVTATAAATAVYQKQFQAAQDAALEAQRQLDEFNAANKPPLSDVDQHRQDQLRLALDFSQIRLGDLKGRIDQAVLAPAVLDVSSIEFQVIDEPRVETAPRGGAKAAASIAAAAVVAGVALSSLLVLIGTLLSNHVTDPADVLRLAPARLFATVPSYGAAGITAGPDLRAALAEIAFGAAPPGRDDKMRSLDRV